MFTLGRIKMKKLVKSLSMVLTVVIILCSIPFVTIASASSWSEDPRYWSQGASDDENMRAVGCWIVAQAKMLRILGIADDADFNPDVYRDWLFANGYLNSNYEQDSEQGRRNPVVYAKTKGCELKYLGTPYATVENVLNFAQKGYYMIAKVKVGDGAHFILLDNETSLSTGQVYCYESWTTNTPTEPEPLSTYSEWYEMYVYSYGESYNYAEISEGEYYIKNITTGKYLTVDGGVDAQGQNVTVGDKMKMSIEAVADKKYTIRPSICSLRVINPGSNEVLSGVNVNIYDNVSSADQWWGFEKVDGGYLIRNMQSEPCVLMVTPSSGNVSVYMRYATDEQVWALEPVSGASVDPTPETYTVTYDMNGGVGSIPPQTKTEDVNLTLSSVVPTREGYTFLGWSTSYSTTNAMYTKGGTYTANASATLYAVWTADLYTVTYDANGGAGTPDSQFKAHDRELQLSATVPTRSGYIFLGWSTDKDSATVAYMPADYYYDNAALELYAVWGIDFAYEITEDGAVLTGCGTEVSGYVTIPDTLGGYPVVRIDTKAFFGCDKITGITMPDTVTTIGGSAFYGCTSLVSVELSDNLQTIWGSVFKNCTSLKSIVIPDQIKIIHTNVFEGCTSLESVVLPEGLKTIAAGAFYGCTALESIRIPSTVTSATGSPTCIGENAFTDCTSLADITVFDAATTIDGTAFYNTEFYNTESNWVDGTLYLGNHLIAVDRSTVQGEFIIKEGTRSIAYHAAQNCDFITSVVIPEGVESIGYMAFANCIYLHSISIPSTVSYIGSNVCTYSTKVSTVHYNGTKADWSKIEIRSNDQLLSANFKYTLSMVSEGSIRQEKGSGKNYQSAGVRYKSRLTKEMHESATEVGFVAAPTSLLNGMTLQEYAESTGNVAITAKVKCEGMKDIIYAVATDSNGKTYYDYQMVITGLTRETVTQNMLDTEISVAMYVVVNGEKQYTETMAYSFNYVLSLMNQQ